MTGLTRDERDSLLLEFEEIPPAEMPRDMSGGVMLKGGFCPYWGGLCYGKSEAFFSGGLKDISVSILAEQFSNGVVILYEEDSSIRSKQDERCERERGEEGV